MSGAPLIGLHVSIAGTMDLAFDRAQEIGATTFQIFTRNPNQWKFNPIPEEVASKFLQKRKSTGFKRLVAHMPYLPNLASPLSATMKISRYTLNEEVKRCDLLEIDYLVAHLGSHLGKGATVGVKNIADACNGALEGSSGETSVLLENMAGQKNSIGSRFEELRAILDKVHYETRVGICLDTCHAYASGFDLASTEAVDTTLGLFDEIVGAGRLKVVHLNDSKGGIGSRLDRHENLGRGRIGTKGIRAFLHHRGIVDRPVIMETPYEDIDGMKQSMAAVRKLMK